MRRALALVGIMLLAACGGSSSSSSGDLTFAIDTSGTTSSVSQQVSEALATTLQMPLCADILDDPHAIATLKDKGACLVGNFIAGTTVVDCDDGTQIAWNDFGWWDADGGHQHVDGAEQVAPADVREACGI